MRARLVFGLIAGLWPAACWAQPVGLAHEDARLTWVEDDPRFGGFSGLELAGDGVALVAISDRGRVLRGRILRDAAGRMTGLRMDDLAPLVPQSPGAWARWEVDSEGLAIAPDGTAYVSFEGMHRVLRFDDLTGPATALPRHPDFRGMTNNASLEALAIGPDGALYTLPERSGRLDRPFPIYRFRDGTWTQPFALPRRDDFLPVGADFGPDGLFYLLERRFSLIRGFASRVRRFRLSDTGLTGEELLFESRPGQYYDLEGLAVWRDQAGRIRLTMIADDNFNFLQSTEVVEYVVGDNGS